MPSQALKLCWGIEADLEHESKLSPAPTKYVHILGGKTVIARGKENEPQTTTSLNLP